MRDSATLVALDVSGGALVVLQRVPRSTTAESMARRLREELGSEVRVVHSPEAVADAAVRVLDGRSLRHDTFARWDQMRPTLARPGSPLVVLLNVEATRALLQAAPHVASWAGGVRLPAEPIIAETRTPAQREAGRLAFARALQADPTLRIRAQGRSVGVVIGSGRTFIMRPDAHIEDQARSELDEGLIYISRVGDE